MVDDVIAAICAGLIVLVLVGAVIGLSVMRYRECRAHGFSAFYCLTSK